MYKSIFLAVALVFCVIGIVAVISFLLIKAVMPDKSSKAYIVYPFSKRDKECAVLVSCAESIISALGLRRRCSIIVLDCGMDEKERSDIEAAFCRSNDTVICSADGFFERIHEEKEE